MTLGSYDRVVVYTRLGVVLCTLCTGHDELRLGTHLWARTATSTTSAGSTLFCPHTCDSSSVRAGIRLLSLLGVLQRRESVTIGAAPA